MKAPINLKCVATLQCVEPLSIIYYIERQSFAYIQNTESLYHGRPCFMLRHCQGSFERASHLASVSDLKLGRCFLAQNRMRYNKQQAILFFISPAVYIHFLIC